MKKESPYFTGGFTLKRPLVHFLCFLFVAQGTAAFAGIVYTDLGGITTHSSEYYDLDQNGTSDIGVVWNYDDWADDTSAEASSPFGAPTDNGFVNAGALAVKLSVGDVIDAGRSYRGDTVMLSRYWDDYDWTYSTWGEWDAMEESETGYLGFQFVDDASELHYGWIQANVDPETQYITLVDMAWEDIANTAIIAGDMGSPVPVPGASWL